MPGEVFRGQLERGHQLDQRHIVERLGRERMIVLGEATEQAAAGVDVGVASEQSVEREALALLGLFLHQLPGFAIERRKEMGRIPVERRQERPRGLGPARGQDRENSPRQAARAQPPPCRPPSRAPRARASPGRRRPAPAPRGAAPGPTIAIARAGSPRHPPRLRALFHARSRTQLGRESPLACLDHRLHGPLDFLARERPLGMTENHAEVHALHVFGKVSAPERVEIRRLPPESSRPPRPPLRTARPIATPAPPRAKGRGRRPDTAATAVAGPPGPPASIGHRSRSPPPRIFPRSSNCESIASSISPR